MAFSYSGITNYGKSTLPSVESWGTNMNILRDPHKSITTRRIDKVGDTTSINQSIDDSGDRNCEAISTYARGVNPMVSVSYNNYGNNGGQNSGGFTSVPGGRANAYSSRTIMKDGEFRPPIMRPEELMPLSRQPRGLTSAFTQPGFADFSKKIRTCGSAEQTKEVKNKVLRSFVRPTAVYKVEKPIDEPFEVKYVIQPSIKVTANSGIRTMDRTTQHVQKPTKEASRDMVYAFAQSNAANSQHYVNNTTKQTSPYMQDTNAHAVFSNQGSKLNVTNIDDILDLSDIRTNELHNIDYNTALSGTDQSSYIHGDIALQRSLPEYESTTNKGENIYKKIEHTNDISLERNTPLTNISVNPGNIQRGTTDESSRNYRLAPKIQAGGYQIPTQIPRKARMQDVRESVQTEKSRMSKSVMEQFQGRYTH